MAKSPTVYDVAERAGVSIATVSFTYRQPHKVRPATQEAVRVAARELGYVPSASARGLANGRTGALGLFSFDYILDNQVPGSAAPDGKTSRPDDDSNAEYHMFPLYVDEVQRGFQLECWRRGYALMIGGQKPGASEHVATDIAGRVDALAVFPGIIATEALDHIARRIPVIVLSEYPRPDDQLAGHVTVEDERGARALADHLIQDHGYRNLEFASTDGQHHISDIRARFAGFQAALKAARLRAPSAPVDSSGHAETLLAALRGKESLPDAVMCATDLLALNLIDALAKAGIDVPGQIAVTGFDGIVAGRLSTPTLTTVRQPMEALGAAAVDILIGRIENPESHPVSRQFPVQTVLRRSCGCPTPD